MTTEKVVLDCILVCLVDGAEHATERRPQAQHICGLVQLHRPGEPRPGDEVSARTHTCTDALIIRTPAHELRL